MKEEPKEIHIPQDRIIEMIRIVGYQPKLQLAILAPYVRVWLFQDDVEKLREGGFDT